MYSSLKTFYQPYALELRAVWITHNWEERLKALALPVTGPVLGDETGVYDHKWQRATDNITYPAQLKSKTPTHYKSKLKPQIYALTCNVVPSVELVAELVTGLI